MSYSDFITPIRTFYAPSGRIIVSKTNDGHFIESTEMRDVTVDGKDHAEVRETLDPKVVWKHLAPVEEKWLCTVSTQVGCPFKCRFCDVAKLGFTRNLTEFEILAQVEMLTQSTPEVYVGGTKKGKIGFARMGEPILNLDNVMKAFRHFKENKSNIDWLLCFNSIVPRRTLLDLERVLEFKEHELDGRMHIQISCNSTDEAKRKWLFGGADVVPVADVVEFFAEREVTNRTITLNFIVMKDVEVSVDKLVRFGLTPDKFAVKLIPLNRTNNSDANGLETAYNYSNVEEMHVLKERFEAAGIPVVVDVTGKCEEASLCCGMLVNDYWPRS